MTHNFQITDKTVYTKTVWTFETEQGDDITVTCEEQDIYDEWYIYSANDGHIDNDSELGQLLINACCEDLNDQHNDNSTKEKLFYNEPREFTEGEPEYDSAGFTEEDRIVNGQYMNTTESLQWDEYGNPSPII